MDEAFNGIGINRDEVYIANIVKCRPPGNRNPEADEAEACLDYLRSQVMLVQPKIIVLLGSVALKNILGEEYGITASRGKWIERKQIKYMATWHPAALLRDENKKIDFWKDLKEVRKVALPHVQIASQSHESRKLNLVAPEKSSDFPMQ